MIKNISCDPFVIILMSSAKTPAHDWFKLCAVCFLCRVELYPGYIGSQTLLPAGSFARRAVYILMSNRIHWRLDLVKHFSVTNKLNKNKMNKWGFSYSGLVYTRTPCLVIINSRLFFKASLRVTRTQGQISFRQVDWHHFSVASHTIIWRIKSVL